MGTSYALDDKNVLKLIVVMVAQLSEYIKLYTLSALYGNVNNFSIKLIEERHTII